MLPVIARETSGEILLSFSITKHQHSIDNQPSVIAIDHRINFVRNMIANSPNTTDENFGTSIGPTAARRPDWINGVDELKQLAPDRCSRQLGTKRHRQQLYMPIQVGLNYSKFQGLWTPGARWNVKSRPFGPSPWPEVPRGGVWGRGFTKYTR